jgi:hypothetical protein
MKITGPGTVRPTELRRPVKAKGGGRESFTVEGSREETGDAPVTKVAPLAPVDALIALQEVDDEPSQDQTAIARGQNLLDRLDELRHGLLIGAIPHHRLEALAQAARRQISGISDPRLAEIVHEIELRAAVELAKYARSHPSQR